MAVFESDRRTLRVAGVERRFVDGRLETDAPAEIRALADVDGVRRVDEPGDGDGGGQDIAASDEVDWPVEGRVARHQGRGWYRFDDEGDDGRAYRLDDLRAEFPDAVIVDDEGDRE